MGMSYLTNSSTTKSGKTGTKIPSFVQLGILLNAKPTGRHF